MSTAGSHARAKKLLKWLLSLVAIFPAIAYAVCGVQVPGSFITISLPASLSSAADNILPGTLFPSTGPVSDYVALYNYTSSCTQKNVKNLTVEPLGQVVSGVTYTDGGQAYPIYETNVPGIGYAFGWSFQYNGPWDAVKPGKTEIFSGAATALTVYYRVSLVATGRLVGGRYTIPRQTLSTLTANLGDGTSISNNSYFGGSGTLNVTTRGCKVTSGATSAVVLPTLVSHSLKSVGAVSDASASFSIAVNCDANVGLYATLTDTSNPTNTSNTLTLAGNSTATGVGIQMFRSGKTTALGLGPDSSAKGNTNQWYVGRSSASGGNFNIPLDAKYVKTEPTIKPGTVSARSTITFSYQ